MKISTNLSRLAIQFGAITSVFVIILFLVFYIGGVPAFDPFYRIDVLVFLPFMVIVLYSWRKTYDELRFWQGFVICFLMHVTITLLVSLFLIVFHNFIDPSFIEEGQEIMKELALQKKAEWMTQGMTEEKFKALVESINKSTVSSIVKDKIIFYSGVGFIYSIILSVLFRK